MRLTFVGAKLDCGGIQRVMSTMANHLAKKGRQVTFVTLDGGLSEPFFALDPRIKLIRLGLYRQSTSLPETLWNNFKRVVALRRAIRESRADAVVSFWTYVNALALISSIGLGVPVIVSEHTYPHTDRLKRPLEWLRRWTYALSAHLVVLTERAKECYPPGLQARIRIIPNPLAPHDSYLGEPSICRIARPSLVAMGRFHRQKGFDLLLKAFSEIKDRHPAWTLTIFGDGPMGPEIEALRDELGLRDRVALPGQVRDPLQALRQADVFVLPSRWEGLPTVLMEAMSLGVAVIASDCLTGPREIIQDGVDGVLVPPEDVEGLAAAMERLMSDEGERGRLASRAVEVKERFSLDKIMGTWEELLKDLIRY